MISPKERPIILTAQEVNAVLTDHKTQYRVPVLTSEQVATGYKCCYGVASGQVIFTKDESDKSFVDDGYISVECPLGSIGDRLWVQEEHRPVNWSFDDGEVTIEYRDGTTKTPHYLTDEEFDKNPNDDYPFAVVDELLDRNTPMQVGRDCFDFSNPENLPHWRAADVMPQFASRLLLEITDIRIERVQDITVINAQAEGSPLQISTTYFASPFHKACGEIMEWFKGYWNNKQSKMSSYEANPWVWVIEFKVIKEGDCE